MRIDLRGIRLYSMHSCSKNYAPVDKGGSKMAVAAARAYGNHMLKRLMMVILMCSSTPGQPNAL
jgi:hypothetical protein